MKPLRQLASEATFWSAADVLGRQGVQFAFTVVLGRLLSPEEFGTVAIIYLFVALGSAVMDGGLSASLVRSQTSGAVDESTVFWMNVILGAVATTVLWVAAPSISWFFQRPEYTPLVRLMSTTIVVSSLGSIHAALLTKRLDFKVQMRVGFVSSLVGGSVAVVLAFRGYGYWAIASQPLAATLTSTTLYWLLNGWRPSVSPSLACARQHLGFGSYMVASTVMDALYNQSYALILGKSMGPVQVGLYYRADTTKQFPAGLLTAILTRVAFPLFAQVASTPDRLRNGARSALSVAMALNVPVMLGLGAAAEPALSAVFGDVWLPAAPILRVLCMAGVLWPLHVINLNVLTAQGHSHLFFRLELAKKAIGLVALVFGALHGALGVAWAMVAYSALSFFVNAHYTRVHLGYGASRQLRDVAPFALSGSIMFFAVMFLCEAWHTAAWIEVAGSAGVGLVVYALLLLVTGLGPIDEWPNVIRLKSKVWQNNSRG